MKYTIDKNDPALARALFAPRRKFLAGIAALGAGTLIPGCESIPPGGGTTAKLHRIDIHHHFVAPTFSDALKARGQGHVQWSVARSLDDMDKSGIALALTSLIQPAVSFGDVPLGRRLAREANEYAAKLVRDHPGRFGMFATIPYTDTEGCLKEIAYVLDTLKGEGFCLMTSYGGKYLGDPAFWPVLEELNRRKAVIYTHPLAPQCCGALVPGVNVAAIEYAVDTTRTMASLLYGGAAAKYPDVRWIFSHSGGVTPFLLSRFVRQETDLKERAQTLLPNGVLYELKKFYYDTAQGNHPGALDALMRIAPVSQVLYGSDFPFRVGDEINAGLASYKFSAAERRAIERDNALRLMPQLKG